MRCLLSMDLSSSNSPSEESKPSGSNSSSTVGGGLFWEGGEDRVGAVTSSVSISSSFSGCERSVRTQTGVEPRRPTYNLNWRSFAFLESNKSERKESGYVLDPRDKSD